MKLYRLHTAQRIATSPETAWTFFSSPANLPRITPPWLGFEVLTLLPERMTPGMIISYRVRPFARFPVLWVSEITHVREGDLFVDEQRFGPYRFWHHQHHFRPVAGGVEVEDLVHYALPADPASRLVADRLVGRPLEEIFAYRRTVLSERFGDLPRSG